MATEAPLLHHSQCTAGQNMSSTAALAGFNNSGQFLVVSLVGGAARSVIIASAATVLPAGILQNDPISGFVADIGFLGVSKVIAAGALTFGLPIMASAAAGTVTTGATFATNYAVGYTLEAAVGALNVITAMIFPAVLD
jgi:hypothetical protein